MILAVLFSITMYGQTNYSAKIHNYLQQNEPALKLSSQDYSDLVIYDQYYTESMQMVHVYAIQKINNIPVFNAIGNFAFKKGEIVYFANSFQSNLKNRVNVTRPKYSPTEAVAKAAIQLGLSLSENPEIVTAESNQEFLLSKSGISLNEIPVKLVYQSIDDNNLRLAWDMSIHTIDGSHRWSIRVDAVTGQIIDKNDGIISCSFPEHAYSNIANVTIAQPLEETFGRSKASILGDGAKYKVFALPTESPNHGDREIVTEPADAAASPFGWHDTDGATGAEYTITRGNNVHAYEDRDGDETPGYSPDGGASLNFDFPLNLDQDPSGYIDAAVTNLFYMNNMMHDIWYQYGFNEVAGNFQETNYTALGAGGDYVIARAQQGSDNGPGDNANFYTPSDGGNGEMNMYTWSAPGGGSELLTINSPTELAGSYIGTMANFGPSIPTAGITADLALLVDDNSGGTSTDPNDGCDVITNAAELDGKIVVIRRGSCNFDAKVLNAQNAGALAVIMVNNEAGLINMAGEDPAINIPSILIGMTDGEALITALSSGTVVNGIVKNNGPFEKDGDLDNGIIAHEYGHGISTRLTGGPFRSNCLYNDEQMGEGWSDFFALVLTMHPTDKATDARGIGTYAINEDTTGLGIRQYRYTTDMTVNPFTYADVEKQFYENTEGEIVVSVHGVGSIWATILWDMTWALIDKYGYDPDVYNGTGGNNIAMQLVIDGLKLQPCSPGFVDGRNAILKADLANNGGDNLCLIWQVFANRGVGEFADQGSTNSIYDQTVDFTMPEDCHSLGTAAFAESTDVFKIYPNPTNGIVHIASSKINGEIQINLFDLNGRKVLSKQVGMSGRATINASELSTGIYIMQLISDGKTQTEKLIIE